MPPPESGADSWQEQLRNLKAEVQKLLKEGELTQTGLAEEAGVSQSLISKLVNDKQISRTVANKLADVLRRRDPDFEWGEPTCRASVYGYCASTGCPSLCLAVLDGVVYVTPKYRRLTRSMPERCPYCASRIYREYPDCKEPVLERALSRRECGAS